MSRHFWIVLGISVAAIAAYYPFSPAYTQRQNMKLASQRLAILKPILKGDPRFSQVEAYVFTGAGGSLWVRGQVASEADASDLKAIVNQTTPTCPIVFRVLVEAATPATTQSGP